MMLLNRSADFVARWLGTGVISLIALTVGSAVSFDNSHRVYAAQVVFDGGLPDLKSANEASAWLQAEDFLLTTATTITGVNFWSIETPNGWNGNPQNGWDGVIRYSIFQDVGGRPDNNPVVYGNATNIAKNATGRSYVGSSLKLDEYAYSFEFNSPVEIAANKTYWLGLHLAKSYNLGYVGNRENLYWTTTNTGYGSNGFESYQGTFDNWQNTGVQHAFQLTSKSENVPEPLTILGSLAAVGFGAALRRKYQNQTQTQNQNQNN